MSDSPETGVTPSSAPIKRTAAYRFLLAAVILLGVLIVIALGVLVAGLVMRFGRHAPIESPAADTILPPGTQVLSTEVSGDRLVMHLRGSGGDEIDVIDLRDGHLVAKFRASGSRR